MISRRLLWNLDAEQPDPSNLSPGSFVEFSCVFETSMLDSIIDTMIKIGEMALMFSGGGKKNRKADEDILKTLKAFRAQLIRDNKIDLVGRLVSSPCYNGYHALVPVDTQYFAPNESTASLLDGQFVVLGKVVRHETERPINLLRRTFGSLPDNILVDLGTSLMQLKEEMDVTIATEIEPPAFEVMPIAIFI